VAAALGRERRALISSRLARAGSDDGAALMPRDGEAGADAE
jgi:hypothetical protein